MGEAVVRVRVPGRTENRKSKGAREGIQRSESLFSYSYFFDEFAAHGGFHEQRKI